MDVIRLDEDFITNFEVWRWDALFVHGGGVVGLDFGDCFPEFLVEFVEVYYKVSSSCGGKVSFRAYRDVQVISLVGEEWGYTSGGIGSIVVCKLHNR